MANENTVLAQLLTWTDASAPSGELLPLCLSGLESVRMRLRGAADEDDLRAVRAAAALALYQYQLKRRITGAALCDVKAGDVVLKSAGDPLDAAARLRDDCFREAAALFIDGDFVFLSC
ncbi:MAG: hypothetical protein LBT21_04025 [Oscillospiraceae bacterium]|jgi:hypothetical protein|nr:hypothetical protein [Oscillospiraceae bacterium]